MTDESKLAKLIAIDDFDGALNLIDQGIGNINSTDKSGATLLMRAVVCNNVAIIKKLLSRGANVNAKDKEFFTALHFAAQDANLAATKELLRAGANINAQDKFGNTPLLRTPSEETEEGRIISQFLIEHGSDVSLKNDYGMSYNDMINQ